MSDLLKLGSHGVKRRLAAIAFLDVVDYSRMMGLSEERTLHAWAILRREVIEPGIAHWQGRIANLAGDGVFAEFRSALDALQWAVELQGLVDRRTAPDGGIRLRVALHLADVIDDQDGEVMGDGVNIAARLQSHATPGGIVASQALVDAVAGKTEVGFQDMGPLQLKNIARPIRAYRISEQPVLVPRPRPRGRRAAMVVMPTAAVALALSVWVWRVPPRERAERLLHEARALVCEQPCPQVWLSRRALLEQAIAVDPTFAAPYADAAFTYTNFVSSDLSTDRTEDLRSAGRLATKAVALAPDKAFAHEARGAVFRQDPDMLESALSSYLRALAIDPARVNTIGNVGWVLILLGRPEEGEAYLRKALAQAPNFIYSSAWLNDLGLAELFLDRDGHGAEYFRQSIAKQSPDPANADIALTRQLNLASALALNGDVAAARKMIDVVRSQHPAISTHNLLWNCVCSRDPVFRAGVEKLRRGAVLAGVLDAG